MSKPRIIIFTGDGKGKSTAAMGLAVRAAGHGMKVRIIQFIKGNPDIGEMAGLSHIPEIEMLQVGLGFVFATSGSEFDKHKQAAKSGLKIVRDTLSAGQHDIVVLDEVLGAVGLGLVDESEVIDAIANATGVDCIVLTGRGATAGLIEIADTVTEMVCVKHGYESGIPAQKGVEF